MHLKFFCDAVVYGSISESAKANYVTQSTVSQAITKLEKILNVELLDHARQKFNVTPEGHMVFEQARHVFHAVQEMQNIVDAHKQEVTGTLNFVSTNSLGLSFLGPLYRQMQLQFPAVQLNFRLGGLNFIRNSLRQGDAEFAIVVYDHSFAQFSKHPLKKGHFQLYQHCEAPLHLLDQGVLIDHQEGMYVSDLKNYFLESNHPPLKIQAELAGWELVARFTDMHIGIGFFPDYITEHERYPQLKIHPQKIPAFEYEICAIYNKGQKPTRAAAAFFEGYCSLAL